MSDLKGQQAIELMVKPMARESETTSDAELSEYSKVNQTDLRLKFAFSYSKTI